MPIRPDRHKPYPRGTRHQAPVAEVRPNSHQRGYNRKWRTFREGFLKRNPMCVHCEARGIITPANEVDHIIPHRGDKQRFWDFDNLAALCKPCHSRKTLAESMPRKC